jgi:hypothetical protein
LLKLFPLILMAFSLKAQLNDETALAIDANLRARHVPHGAILDPIFEAPDSDQVSHYTRCGDSAIWTGHYLAAQSFRYAATRTPEALEGVYFALEGIRRLIDVTGTDVLARCALPANSPDAARIVQEDGHHGVFTGNVYGEQWLWIGNTSRDQYLGVFFGLTATWNLVDVQEVHDRVSWLTTRLLAELLNHSWLVKMPNGNISTTFLGRADQQLALLKLGRRLNPQRFERYYKALSNGAAPAVVAPIALEALDPHGSYFKFNLDAITFWSLLTSGDNWLVQRFYEAGYNLFRRATDDHQNAFFDLVDRGINGPSPGRDARTITYLEQWLERPRRDFAVDRRGEVAACGENRACEPLPVHKRVATDFVWQRSPFQLYAYGDGYIESAGIDFLLPYWMARYYGVIH